MTSIVSPFQIQRTSTKFLQKRKRSSRRLARPLRLQAALPSPDIMNYAQGQLITWILPMTIAGRLLKLDYPNIVVGLTLMTIAKLSLAANGVINY